MVSFDAATVNRFMGMMDNWLKGTGTSYFYVSFSEDGIMYEVKVPSSKEGFYTRGFGYVRK
jgi:hypothetical protein